MSAWDALGSMLETDPRDAGCAETFELIHTYAEIVVNGGDPEAAMPGITVHLESCGPCAEDYLGLLSALRAEADSPVEQ
jgi:hypothetical protein